MELENHHFAGAMAITNSGKTHQGVLKLLGKRLMKKNILHRLIGSQHKLLINYQGKNSNLTVEKPGRHHLN